MPGTSNTNGNDNGNANADGAAKGELNPSLEWSLDEVEKYLPEVPDGAYQRVRASLIGAAGDGALIALGTSFRTEDIYASAAPFAVGGLLALRKLGDPPVGLPLALFPLLVHEGQELGRVNASFEQEQRDVDAEISGRRARLKLKNGEALRSRRGAVQTLLRYVVPADSPKRAELEAAGAGVDSYAGTVASVRTVARVLGELRKDDALRPVLDDYGYTAAKVADMRALADEVERLNALGAGLKPPLMTTQHALDRQDGLVLTIMRAISGIRSGTPGRRARPSTCRRPGRSTASSTAGAAATTSRWRALRLHRRARPTHRPRHRADERPRHGRARRCGRSRRPPPAHLPLSLQRHGAGRGRAMGRACSEYPGLRDQQGGSR